MFENSSSNRTAVMVALLLIISFILGKLDSDMSSVTQSDQEFETAFIELYGFDSSGYLGLGPDGFVGRWASESEMANLSCKSFEFCQFVVLATVEDCPRDVSLTFQILDEMDAVRDTGKVSLGTLNGGDFATVEIGSESGDGLYLAPYEAECLIDLPQV